MDGSARHKGPAVSEVRQVVPVSGVSSSDGRGWEGISAVRFRHLNDDIDLPPLSRHLVVVHQGRPSGVEERIDHRVLRRHMSRGAVTVIPAGVASEFRWEEAPDTLHVYLSPSLVEGVAAELGADADGFEVLGALGARDREAERIGASLLSELENGGLLGGRLYAGAIADQLAVHLLRRYSSLGTRDAARVEREPGGGLAKGALRQALDYVESNLARGMTIAEIASVANVSPHHFSRLFKLSTGLAPHRYLIERRVERARGLLLEGEMPISVIAREVGFADQAHLTRHAKERLGVTPREILKSGTITQEGRTNIQDGIR